MHVTVSFFVADVWLTIKGLLTIALLSPSERKTFCQADEIKSGGGGFLKSLLLRGTFKFRIHLMLADTPFFPSSMNGFSVIMTCADLLNFACLFLLYIYGWYSLDIITDMHRTKEKIIFGNLTQLLWKTT